MVSGDKPLDVMWQCHAKGEALLLRLRGPAQFATARGRALFRMVNANMALWDLGDGGAAGGGAAGFTYGVAAWPADLYETPVRAHANGLPASAAALAARAAALQREYRRDADWAARIAQLAEEAAALDAELRAWCDDCPDPALAPCRVLDPRPARESPAGGSGARTPTPPLYPRLLSAFPTAAAAIHALRVQGARVILLQRLHALRAAAAAAALPHGTVPGALAVWDLAGALQGAGGAVCDAVPSALGEVDAAGRLAARVRYRAGPGLMVLWALHVVAAHGALDEAPARWVLRQLGRVGAACGFRQGAVLERWHVARRQRLAALGGEQRRADRVVYQDALSQLRWGEPGIEVL